MVISKKITKNKNILFEVEDLTGKATLLVNANKKEVFEKAKEILLDEVVGFRCSGNNELLFVNEIIFPDIFLSKKKKFEKEEYIAFISDLHVGSSKFLEENFNKFIEWLNGKIGKREPVAKKIKYLIITGDTVDGVGIYPGQEELLSIKDIRKQYEKLAELLKKIREDITIIMCPGQHDAVRVAEPQPPFDKKYSSPLYNIKNIILVSNPALIEIGNNEGNSGIKILLYHGASLHNIINEIEYLRIGKAHDTPSKVLKILLKKRHLAPSHDSTTYIPTQKDDPLLIKEIPDILAVGEIHRSDVDTYNNILTINSSCWQSITPFEEKVGNHPEPCKVPILNLKTGQIKIFDFS